jgi:hypothetical protein
VTPPSRAVALSEQLTRVHASLRDRLVFVRQQVAERGEPAPGVAMPDDLLSYCLGFCAAVRTHHSGEDGQLLPALRAAAPGLAPVIGKLAEDHELVAGILRRIRDLLDPGQAPAGPETLLRELDGLTAILESHFGYEERRIAQALDALGPGGWVAEVFAPDEAAGPAA